MKMLTRLKKRYGFAESVMKDIRDYGRMVQLLAAVVVVLGLIFLTSSLIQASLVIDEDGLWKYFTEVDTHEIFVGIGTFGLGLSAVLALFFSTKTFFLQREERQSGMNLTMEIDRYGMSESDDVLAAIVYASNKGESECNISRVVWEVQVLGPYSETVVDEIFSYIEGSDLDDVVVPWRYLSYYELRDDVSIDRNAVEIFSQEFRVPVAVGAVIVSCWLENANSEIDGQGWFVRKSHGKLVERDGGYDD